MLNGSCTSSSHESRNCKPSSMRSWVRSGARRREFICKEQAQDRDQERPHHSVDRPPRWALDVAKPDVVDPTTALQVGLKVDADALPAGILETVDLRGPATTVAVLTMNAVVGVQATVDADNRITRLGITCALCHSTVDNSVMPGIGHRRDGWPNRELNVRAIIALSPVLSADKKAVCVSWVPGKYDPGTTRTRRTRRSSCRPRTDWPKSRTKRTPPRGRSHWNAYIR